MKIGCCEKGNKVIITSDEVTSFPRGRRGPALRHSCQRLCAGLEAAKLHRHVALLATLSPTTPARRPSKQHGVSDTTPFALARRPTLENRTALRCSHKTRQLAFTHRKQ